MATSETNFIAHINFVSSQVNRYFSIIIFLFGIVGNILNVLVLCQRTFRTNPCAYLFMVSSLANIVAILSGLTSRMLSGWAADLTNTDQFLCKLRAFVLNVARPIAFWLILLAAIDRWLLSSPYPRLRLMSNLKNAQRGIALVSLLSLILFSHIIYCYEPNLRDAPLRCYGITITCRFVTDICFTFVTILIPLLLMLVFGLLTIRNVRHSRHRTNPRAIATIHVDANQKQRNQGAQRNTDYRLLLMLLVQILLLFIFGVPLGIQKLYATITVNQSLSRSQIALDNFVYGFVLLLNFLANGMPFYIYTLVGGSVFRQALGKMFFVRRSAMLRPTNTQTRTQTNTTL